MSESTHGRRRYRFLCIHDNPCHDNDLCIHDNPCHDNNYVANNYFFFIDGFDDYQDFEDTNDFDDDE